VEAVYVRMRNTLQVQKIYR